MGMFDSVKRDPVICPNCGKGVISEFQTKCGHCRLFNLTEDQLVIDAGRLGNSEPYYYGYCDECRTCVTFSFVPGHWEKSYETVEQRKKRNEEEAEFWKKYRQENSL